MISLQSRSYQQELLDGSDIPFADIERNMYELNIINTLLGGHAITIRGFKRLLAANTTISVCEIGCGGGDNLAAIVKWCDKNGIAVQCIGVDMKAECIAVASAVPLLKGRSHWITSDYRKLLFDQQPDIIFSSLFCHHFSEEELTMQLRWMQEKSKLGFFINDLHRHPLAYHSIRLLTRLFSSSYLVKHDAPLSVARGFIKQEWVKICERAGLPNTRISWQWAFRYLLISRKHE